MINALGYIAILLNIVSMAMKNILYLRICSLVANSLYILYGIFLNAMPIIFGGSIAVMLHAYRIKQFIKNNEKDNVTT